MKNFNDKMIVESWKKNVSPWLKAIQNNEIDSRETITNQAIIDAIALCSVTSVLDVGCGEGWLTRELSERGMRVTGVDATEELIAYARQQGAGTFQVLEYEAISVNTIQEKYDLAVCNFSLLGKESVEHIFKVVPSLLHDGGFFIVQTLSPDHFNANSRDTNDSDGWREGSWTGFSDEFSDPAPWYFRTFESWLALFQNSGFTLHHIHEPIHLKTGNVASLIIVGRVEV